MRIKLKIILCAAILNLSLCSPALLNKNSDSMGIKLPFDMKQFNERYQTALYLLRYDMTALCSTDSVMNEPESVKIKLGKEWFCVKLQNDWHASYGRYDTITHSYDQILHYVITKNGNAVKTDRILDSTISNPAARSIRTCLKESDSLISFYRSFYVNFNIFYKKDSMENNRVWLLPGTTGEKAVYGMDISFDVSPSGDSIIHKEIVGQKLRYYIPGKNKEAILGNDYSDIPALGNIYYALHHHDDFKKVVIHNKKWASSLIANPKTQELSWLHEVRQADSARERQ
jgi:hypothetical protein